MKALFGVVSLLVALAIVGLVVSKQLKAVRAGVSAPGPAAAASNPGTVADQSRQMQEKIRADVVKALEQGAQKEEPNP